RFLAEREMAGALDQVLQEQVEGSLFGFAQLELRAKQAQPHRLANVVVRAVDARCAGGGEERFLHVWTCPNPDSGAAKPPRCLPLALCRDAGKPQRGSEG